MSCVGLKRVLRTCNEGRHTLVQVPQADAALALAGHDANAHAVAEGVFVCGGNAARYDEASKPVRHVGGAIL